MASRSGSFGTSLNPFGASTLSDLADYNVGTVAIPVTQGPEYNPAAPPARPSVAPEYGVMPQPVIPVPAVPAINYTQGVANVLTMQGYVNTLQRVQNPTQAQQTALATDLAQLAKVTSALPADIAGAAANVAKMQTYVNTLQAVKNPTPAQQAALATDLARLAKNQATLKSLTGG